PQPQPVAEPKSQPVPQPQPVAEPESQPVPESQPEREPVVVSERQPGPAALAEPQPVAEHRAAADAGPTAAHHVRPVHAVADDRLDDGRDWIPAAGREPPTPTRVSP